MILRLQKILEADDVWLSDDQRVQAGRLLIEHARIFRSDLQPSNAIVATRRLIKKGVGGSLHRGRWLITTAYAYFEEGNAAESLEYLHQARTLADQNNSLRLQFELRFALANHWMKAQMLPEAEEELERLEHLAESCPPAQRAEFARIKARLFLLQDRYAEGLRWAEDAMRLAGPAGFSGANLAVSMSNLSMRLQLTSVSRMRLKLIKQHDAVPIEAGMAIADCLEFLVDWRHRFTTAALRLKERGANQFPQFAEIAPGVV